MAFGAALSAGENADLLFRLTLPNRQLRKHLRVESKRHPCRRGRERKHRHSRVKLSARSRSKLKSGQAFDTNASTTTGSVENPPNMAGLESATRRDMSIASRSQWILSSVGAARNEGQMSCAAPDGAW